MLVHSNGDDINIIEQQQVFVTLAKLKQQGLIRCFGMSTKTIAGGLLTLEYADVVMATYNLANTSEQPILDKAKQLNKSILIKKALASGHVHTLSNHDPIQNCFKLIYQQPAVTSIIIGTINPQHLTQNINYAYQAISHT